MRYLSQERDPSRVRVVKAQFATRCPQCRKHLKVGEEIGQPQEINEEGGNRFRSFWYCVPCAVEAQSQTYQNIEANLDVHPGWRR